MLQNWIEGVRTILWSQTGRFYFTTLNFEDQVETFRQFFNFAENLDESLQEQFVKQLVFETFNFKPYSVLMFLVLAQLKQEQKDKPYMIEAAELVFKNLSEEDFAKLEQFRAVQMTELS